MGRGRGVGHNDILSEKDGGYIAPALAPACWQPTHRNRYSQQQVLEAEGSSQSTQSPVNPRWLAPEILKGARASAQTDVFSYGVVMWEASLGGKL